MVCMHITGKPSPKQPPKQSPKVVSMKVNSTQVASPPVDPNWGLWRLATVYFQHAICTLSMGERVFPTMYGMARKRKGNTEYIILYLPDELSQVLILYLVYVSPFARALPLDRRESEYLFGIPKDYRPERNWARHWVESQRSIRLRLTASWWRHVAIRIATRHLVRPSNIWEKDDKDAEEEGDDFGKGDD